MRNKINHLVKPSYTEIVKSDLYKRFQSPFSILLNPNNHNVIFHEFDQIYVKNKNIEKELSVFLNSFQDDAKFLIGLIGIGKTTVLKNFFKITSHNPSFVERNSLVLPIMLDPSRIHSESVESILQSIIGAAWEFIEEEKQIDWNTLELYEFIKENKRSLLHQARKKPQENPNEIINNLFNDLRMSYNEELLKLLLIKSDIGTIVIVLDGIESHLDWETHNIFIHGVCKIWKSLKDHNKKSYCSKLIISGRPDTFRILKSENFFNSYAFSNPFTFNETQSLSKIFEARFNYLIKSGNAFTTSDRDSWESAYCILKDLCNELKIHNESLLVNLHNYNLRDAMNSVTRILSNRMHIQIDPKVKSAFKIRRENFRFNQVASLRSLAYGVDNLYFEHTIHPFANLFHNNQDSKNDLIGPYIIKYFLTFETDEYHGEYAYTSLKYLKDQCANIFDYQDPRSGFHELSIRFIKKGVLFVSPNDTSGKEHLCLSPKGRIMWRLLQKGTILMEFFMQDVWIDRNIFEMKEIYTASEKVIIERLFKFLAYYIEREAYYVKLSNENKTLDLYRKLFGTESITEHLYQGFLTSCRKLFQNDRPSEIDHLLKEYNQKINEIQNILNS